jgi:hypothetical protein
MARLMEVPRNHIQSRPVAVTSVVISAESAGYDLDDACLMLARSRNSHLECTVGYLRDDPDRP